MAIESLACVIMCHTLDQEHFPHNLFILINEAAGGESLFPNHFLNTQLLITTVLVTCMATKDCIPYISFKDTSGCDSTLSTGSKLSAWWTDFSRLLRCCAMYRFFQSYDCTKLYFAGLARKWFALMCPNLKKHWNQWRFLIIYDGLELLVSHNWTCDLNLNTQLLSN